MIYEHISPSGKVYVGQTYDLKIRWQGKGHMYLNKTKKGKYAQSYFAHALLKYGWDAFEHKIILEGVSKSEANYAEKYLIKWYKLHKMSYNMTDGGEGICGLKRPMSLEMRQRITERMRTNHPLKGTHRTEKQKQSAREKMLGRKMSAEAVAKMAESHRGVPQPSKYKKVYAFDKHTKEFIKEYISISEAAKDNNLHNSAIGNAARGKYPSAGPYIWSFSPIIDVNNPRYKMMENLKVHCYSKEGDYLQTFENTRAAAAFVNGIINCISDCCSGRILSYKGYLWRKQLKTKEELQQEIKEIKLKRIKKCA
jgi:group I intron endonuclease